MVRYQTHCSWGLPRYIAPKNGVRQVVYQVPNHGRADNDVGLYRDIALKPGIVYANGVMNLIWRGDRPGGTVAPVPNAGHSCLPPSLRELARLRAMHLPVCNGHMLTATLRRISR